MAEEPIKTGDQENKGAGDTVSKVDFDALKADHDKSMKDLEQMRDEVLTPDYMEFLNAKKAPKGGDKVEAGPELSEEAISKLSPKEILKLATERATKALKDDIVKVNARIDGNAQAATSREVKAFADDHGDYETYRPIMYGLSTEAAHKSKSLLQLYNLAKKHVEDIPGFTKEEKVKEEKIESEKPSGSSGSFGKEGERKSDGELTAEALKETKEKLGPIPPA